jgi:hypothetical protein
MSFSWFGVFRGLTEGTYVYLFDETDYAPVKMRNFAIHFVRHKINPAGLSHKESLPLAQIPAINANGVLQNVKTNYPAN